MLALQNEIANVLASTSRRVKEGLMLMTEFFMGNNLWNHLILEVFFSINLLLLIPFFLSLVTIELDSLASEAQILLSLSMSSWDYKWLLCACWSHSTQVLMFMRQEVYQLSGQWCNPCLMLKLYHVKLWTQFVLLLLVTWSIKLDC